MSESILFIQNLMKGLCKNSKDVCLGHFREIVSSLICIIG